LGIVEPGDTVGVVTSSWHLPRAMREFQQQFEHVVAVPAFDVAVDEKRGLLRWMPRSRHLASPATALAEYIGMIWYRIGARGGTPPGRTGSAHRWGSPRSLTRPASGGTRR